MEFSQHTMESGMKILLAIDGSEHSLAALSLLHDLPLPSQTLVTALGVFLPRNASDYYIFEPILLQTEEELRRRGLQARSELLAGSPAEVIHQVADSMQPHLILLGAKGRRATLGILLGGVAQQVVEYSDRPVLVVRAPYVGLRRILLVTDGSYASQCSVEFLGRLPLQDEVSVDVLHVLPPPPLPQPLITAPIWTLGYERGAVVETQTEAELQAIQDEEKRAGETLLVNTCDQLNRLFTAYRQADQPPIPVTSVLLQGDAATEIIEYANLHQTNLIVAGSRGLSRVQGWLLGSVSRKLLHYSKCSVLVVRCPPE
jgi:nucleotide-binding universal stress UspA family protein